MLKEEIGNNNFQRTKELMETYWNKSVTNLRDYFEMIDARVAELK